MSSCTKSHIDLSIFKVVIGKWIIEKHFRMLGLQKYDSFVAVLYERSIQCK